MRQDDPPGTIELPASDAPQVSIAIIATRDGPRLARCLAAIAEHAPAAIGVEVILVLNDAAADVRELVAQRVRGARIVDPVVNAGTAGGWNLALLGARGRWLHLLHEDTEVRAGWLEPLVAALEEHPEAAAAGSRLVYPDGTLQNVGWVAWRDGWVTQIRDVFLPEASAQREIGAVDHLSSAAMLIDRDDLLAAGGFEERLSPGIFVDAHLGLQLWSRGRASLIVPASEVLHTEGAMVGRDGDPYASEQFRVWLFLRNFDTLREIDADILGEMEPRTVTTLTHDGFDADGIRRSLARAEARRAAATPQRPAPAPPGPLAGAATWGPSPEEGARLRTERAAAERAFVTWLVENEGQARRSLEELLVAAANWEREQAALREAYEAADAHARRLEAQLAAADAAPRRRWRWRWRRPSRTGT